MVPKVLVHGIFCWGESSRIRGSCWPSALRGEPDWIFSQETGAVSSAHDRACELFYELYGGRIDYGAEHSSTFKHKRFGAALKAKWPNWSADSPIDLIGHSYGGNVCIDLALKLTHDFFGVGSDAQWVRSIVTLSSPINGTTLVYLLGLSLSDHRTVRTLSAIHLAGAFLATFWRLTIALPVLRRLYDFRIRQWEAYTSLYDIWTMRHVCVTSTDNAFHDLAPPRRHAENPSTADLSALFLFSVSSKVSVRSTRFRLAPWSGRSIEIALPWGTYNPVVLVVSLLIRLHALRMWLMSNAPWHGEGDGRAEPFEGAASGAWAHSDGIVNTCSQGAPFGQSQHAVPNSAHGEPSAAFNHNEFSANTQRLSLPVERPASLRPGVWYRMHMGRDHFATKNLDNLRRIAALLDALPTTPPANKPF